MSPIKSYLKNRSHILIQASIRHTNYPKSLKHGWILTFTGSKPIFTILLHSEIRHWLMRNNNSFCKCVKLRKVQMLSFSTKQNFWSSVLIPQMWHCHMMTYDPDQIQLFSPTHGICQKLISSKSQRKIVHSCTLSYKLWLSKWKSFKFSCTETDRTVESL